MEIISLMAGVYAANCYIVYNDNKNAFIVDPGGDADDIVKKIEENDIKPKFIILTHGHGDHIGAVDFLRNKFEIPCLASEDEIDLLASSEINISSKMPGPDVEIIPNKTFKDGDTISEDEFNIKVISTPGHTCGSVCFIVDKFFITGDTLFKGSIGRTDLATSSSESMQKSLFKILKLDDSLTVLPGHGGASTLGYEKNTNPFLIRLKNPN